MDDVRHAAAPRESMVLIEVSQAVFMLSALKFPIFTPTHPGDEAIG